MEDHPFLHLGWLALTAAPFLAGMASAMLLRCPTSLFLAAGLPWCLFLLFNAYTGLTSPDRELLQGTFLFFQLTLGSVCAISGACGHWFLHRVLRRKGGG